MCKPYFWELRRGNNRQKITLHNKFLQPILMDFSEKVFHILHRFFHRTKPGFPQDFPAISGKLEELSPISTGFKMSKKVRSLVYRIPKKLLPILPFFRQVPPLAVNSVGEGLAPPAPAGKVSGDSSVKDYCFLHLPTNTRMSYCGRVKPLPYNKKRVCLRTPL